VPLCPPQISHGLDLGPNPGPPWWEAGDEPPEPWHGLKRTVLPRFTDCGISMQSVTEKANVSAVSLKCGYVMKNSILILGHLYIVLTPHPEVSHCIVWSNYEVIPMAYTSWYLNDNCQDHYSNQATMYTPLIKHHFPLNYTLISNCIRGNIPWKCAGSLFPFWSLSNAKDGRQWITLKFSRITNKSWTEHTFSISGFFTSRYQL
jgi:hypothetical protein